MFCISFLIFLLTSSVASASGGELVAVFYWPLYALGLLFFVVPLTYYSRRYINNKYSLYVTKDMLICFTIVDLVWLISCWYFSSDLQTLKNGFHYQIELETLAKSSLILPIHIAFVFRRNKTYMQNLWGKYLVYFFCPQIVYLIITSPLLFFFN